MGFRRGTDIALPACLSSLHSAWELVEIILSNINMVEASELSDAEETWKRLSEEDGLPDSTNSQKSWDIPLATALFNELSRGADQVSRARLLAASRQESGAWLGTAPDQ